MNKIMGNGKLTSLTEQLAHTIKENGLFDDDLRLCFCQKLMVLMPTAMNAVELANIASTLYRLADELTDRLLEHCETHTGDCDDPACSLCDTAIQEPIIVPEWMREAAGIDPHAKLTGYVADETGEIRLKEAGYRYDLSDIPSEYLLMLRDNGICLADLEDIVKMEELIYAAE